MTVLVTGDRNWSNEKTILRELQKLSKNTTIVQGGAKGADSLAAKVGKELGLKVITVKADWSKFGRAAGPIRNKVMLEKYNPDLVLAFHGNIESSKGTKDMITRAQKAGKKVILYAS